MDIDDIRAFVAVADGGSISRAAGELYLTQPAVTRRLQRLEDACGAPLLDRRRRPFTLTAAGGAIVERCREVLVSVHELRGALAAGSAPAGELRIGVAHALTDTALVLPVERLQARFRGVRLRFDTGWSRAVLDRVRTRALDAGLVFLPADQPLPSGVTGQIVATEQLLIVEARRAPARRRVRDLAGASWVLSPDGCAARAGLLRALRQGRADGVIAVETYTYELQLSLVARGRGLGLVPARILAASPHRRDVRVHTVAGLAFPLSIWSVRGRYPGALEPVLDALEQELSVQLAGAATRSGALRRA